MSASLRTVCKRGVVLVLHAWDGLPMPEGALVSAVQAHARPLTPTESDVLEAVKDCEATGLVVGVTDEFTRERTWSLTAKGEHQARQLR